MGSEEGDDEYHSSFRETGPGADDYARMAAAYPAGHRRHRIDRDPRGDVSLPDCPARFREQVPVPEYAVPLRAAARGREGPVLRARKSERSGREARRDAGAAHAPR